MTREEAEDILRSEAIDVTFSFAKEEIIHERREAFLMGSAALRRLDELERWAKAWLDYWDAHKRQYSDYHSEGRVAAFESFTDALNGSMEWPEGGGK